MLFKLIFIFSYQVPKATTRKNSAPQKVSHFLLLLSLFSVALHGATNFTLTCPLLQTSGKGKKASPDHKAAGMLLKPKAKREKCCLIFLSARRYYLYYMLQAWHSSANFMVPNYILFFTDCSSFAWESQWTWGGWDWGVWGVWDGAVWTRLGCLWRCPLSTPLSWSLWVSWAGPWACTGVPCAAGRPPEAVLLLAYCLCQWCSCHLREQEEVCCPLQSVDWLRVQPQTHSLSECILGMFPISSLLHSCLFFTHLFYRKIQACHLSVNICELADKILDAGGVLFNTPGMVHPAHDEERLANPGKSWVIIGGNTWATVLPILYVPSLFFLVHPCAPFLSLLFTCLCFFLQWLLWVSLPHPQEGDWGRWTDAPLVSMGGGDPLLQK